MPDVRLPDTDLAPYLVRWGLTPDGEPFETHSSRLLPVQKDGAPAMLKAPHYADERLGAVLLDWWGGQGAARVLARDERVALLERAATGLRVLDLVIDNRDDEATHVLCDMAARLHAPRLSPPPEALIPLAEWFRALEPVANAEGGFFAQAAEAAREVLANQTEIVPLHGDLHHENVLDFGPRGWLAIDPKPLIGDRAFDYAILFCDPDLGQPELNVATRPEIFAQRLAAVIAASGLERRRLLTWILAWTGLTSAWNIEDGEAPSPIPLAVGAMAAAALDA